MRILGSLRSSSSSFLILAAVAACSDGGGGDAPIDAPGLAANQQYVVSRIQLPATSMEANQFGLDIDEQPADGIDNNLGVLVSALRNITPGVDAVTATTLAVDRGAALLLLELRSGVSPASLASAAGRDPQPPACTGATDPVCRHHLTGGATIAIDPAAGIGTALTGALDGASFSGGTGIVLLPMSLPSAPPFVVPLRQAKVELRRVSGTGFGAGKLGGGVTVGDLNATFTPAVWTSFQVLIERDCAPPPRSPPTCGCPDGTTGRTLLELVNPSGDCELDQAEVDRFIADLLSPDLDLDGDGIDDAISFGVGLDGVAASFPELP